VPAWDGERMSADVHLILLFQVTTAPGRASGWTEGPLPLPVLLAEPHGGERAKTVTAEAKWRRQYLLPRVSEILTGRSRGVTRSHRVFGPEQFVAATGDATVMLEALELLAVRHPSRGRLIGRRRGIGVLAAHLRVLDPAWTVGDAHGDVEHGSNARRIIGGIKHLCRDLARPVGTDIQWSLPASLQSVVGRNVSAAKGYDNAYLAVLLTPRAGTSTASKPIPDSPELWNLAMASPSRRAGPPGGDQDVHDAGLELQLPKTQVLVTRFGLVHRGRGTGDAMLPTTSNGQDRYRFRTIYLDGLIMAMMQQRLLDELTEDAAGLADAIRNPRGFNRLSLQFRRFRVIWWWRDFSRWRHPDRVVDAVQEVLDLDRRYEELRDDHAFFADTLRAAQTTRTNRLILLLAVLSTAGVGADIASALRVADERVTVASIAAGPLVALLFWVVWVVLIARRWLLSPVRGRA